MQGPRDESEDNMEGSFRIRRLNNEVIADQELIREQNAIIQRKRKQISELNEDILGATNEQSEARKRIKVKQRSMRALLDSSSDDEKHVKANEERSRRAPTGETPPKETIRREATSKSHSSSPQPASRPQIQNPPTNQQKSNISPCAAQPQILSSTTRTKNLAQWPKLVDPEWISAAAAAALRYPIADIKPTDDLTYPRSVIYARAFGIPGWKNGVDHLIGVTTCSSKARTYSGWALFKLTCQNSNFAWLREDLTDSKLSANNKPGGSSFQVWFEHQLLDKPLIDSFWMTA